jgi:methyl-accepting chemotaxis protein
VAQGSALVDRAGATMSEVVGAIRRVTDIVGEISAASHEQSLGVAQVGEAVTQMDQVTQQNAALVEEMAAASSLKSQAEDLVQVVSVFQLEDEGGSHLGQASLQRTRQSLQIQ